MAALSLILPDKLAEASQKAARKLGVSRTQFIRQAIVHELQNLQAQLELESMAKSFSAMKKHSDYLQEMNEIDKVFSTDLPNDKEQWWKKKKEKKS